MNAILMLAVLLMGLGLWEGVARAEGATTSFALIVTNNRSARLSRPDLRYADDDGAKYYELFRMVAPESNVALLTTFDHDTQKLFPHLVGKERAPSRTHVQEVVKEFVEKVSAAKLRGPVDFYFVFAGHGDIDQGKGFLELSDGSFTSDDLESLLGAMPATRSHVILDSCNSFFVINSRKPGGRHFVTSEEATKNLSARLPNVGVFLSTSAEAEVYEWSELQSGVFSHAVRSGLSGAADANHDGQVSYDELRAFVNIATKDVKNPNYRPQVFARGPGGRGGAFVLDLTKAQAARIGIDGAQRRLTVRDQDEVPWVDLHKEAGKPLTVHLPLRVAANAAVDEADGSTGAILRRYRLEGDHGSNENLLAALASSEARANARGPDDMFRMLFARPFGAAAYAQLQAEESKVEPIVLGVSADQRERLRLLLHESADSAGRRRVWAGAAGLGLGLTMGLAGGLTLARGIRTGDPAWDIAGGLWAAGGAYITGYSLVTMVRPTFQERTYETFVRSLELKPEMQQAQRLYAEAEQQLLKAADDERSARVWNRWIGGAIVLYYGGGLAYAIAQEQGDLSRLQGWPVTTLMFGGTAVFGAVTVVDSFFPTTTERMADLWKNDPGLVRSRTTGGVQVKPFFGVLSAGLSGTF